MCKQKICQTQNIVEFKFKKFSKHNHNNQIKSDNLCKKCLLKIYFFTNVTPYRQRSSFFNFASKEFSLCKCKILESGGFP